MQDYFFNETERIGELLIEIKALKIVFATITPLPHIEENIRRESLLKSSLYSARVEGNPLTLANAREIREESDPEEIQKLEVANLLKAYKFVYSSKVPEQLSESLIFNLHFLTMKGISKAAGKYREEPWAIFNQAGVAVYLAPSPFRIPELMQELMDNNLSSKTSPPIKAAIVQFILEKIHPFADGNGRVGRLLSAYVLRHNDFGFKGLLSFEEFTDDNRERYYEALEPNKDMTVFAEFFLESLVSQAKKVLEKLKEKREELPEDSLLPRRREVLEIIKDHPQCSFDFLSRRFQNINQKTLHYDLKQLQNKGFVQKIGNTRGSLYKVKA
jgi:Fic family protein